jgi:hypothetical protein
MRFLSAALLILNSFISINAFALTVEFHSIENFKSADIEKLNLAKHLIEVVLNSHEFKSKVLNFKFRGKKQFVQNNGMSNRQIYETLMAGAERFPKSSEANQQMDVDLEIYFPKWWQNQKVLGYTTPDDPIIHINRSFYSSAEVQDLAMNIVHEWCHKVGFDHDFKTNDRRPYTVPYAIGYLVRDLGALAILPKHNQ